MCKSPRDVFSAFNDIECLKSIARYRGISHDDSREKLVDELSLNISAHGLELLLRIISLKELKALAKNCYWGEEKISSSRAALAKKIYETMEEITPRKFLESCDSAVLKEILKELQVEVPAKSRKDYTDEILRVADMYGLENCFSSFTSQKLKEFIKACGLKVDTDSMDILLQCLTEQESIKVPFKSDEPHSETKPPIDKDIKTVDLNYHYFREDLSQWCDQHELSGSGSKTEIIRRIRRYFDGKLEEKDMKKKKPTRQSAEKSKTTETPEKKVNETKTPIKQEKKKTNWKGYDQ
jgi:hypothetical protein